MKAGFGRQSERSDVIETESSNSELSRDRGVSIVSDQ